MSEIERERDRQREREREKERRVGDSLFLLSYPSHIFQTFELSSLLQRARTVISSVGEDKLPVRGEWSLFGPLQCKSARDDMANTTSDIEDC